MRRLIVPTPQPSQRPGEHAGPLLDPTVLVDDASNLFREGARVGRERSTVRTSVESIAARRSLDRLGLQGGVDGDGDVASA